MSKNMLSKAADRYWFSQGHWICPYPDGDCNCRTLSNAAFNEGARWAMRETTRLNPYVSQFIEMLILLGVFDDAMEKAPNASDSAGAGEATAGGQDGEHNERMPALSGDVHISDADTWHDARLL